ncbi:hypothetical protein [Rhodopseudomonas palustris]|uniref:hypothetical protein n=1 Tax=Rhodopseudomonas palustris TaxID=1076 RepID=UPI000CEBC91F|nr:hypothetical protein [Rhodopseudomonas palustris]PPQ42183.1 hypothetical protein CKO39_18510 [Rhodopseudomonas palustris]
MTMTSSELAASLQDKVGQNWDTSTMVTEVNLSTGITWMAQALGYDTQVFDDGINPTDYGQKTDRLVVHTNNQTAEITGISAG